MTIFAWSVDTWFNLTLMCRVKPASIKNKVEFGFFFKKKPEAGSSWVQILQKPSPTYLKLKLPKNPSIFTNLFSHFTQPTT